MEWKRDERDKPFALVDGIYISSMNPRPEEWKLSEAHVRELVSWAKRAAEEGAKRGSRFELVSLGVYAVWWGVVRGFPRIHLQEEF